MRQQHIVVFLLLLTSSMIAVTARAETMRSYYCPGSSATLEERSRHIDLLKYAVLANSAYKELGQTTFNLHRICPMGISAQIQDSVIAIKSIPDNIINTVVDRVRETNSNWIFDTYSDNDGEKFFTCSTDQSVGERLLVAFRYVFDNEGLSFLMKAAIVGISGLTAEQKIGIVELENATGEKIIAIQGTDLSSIDQWNSAIRSLIESQNQGSSCIFPFIVEVATHFFGKDVAGEIHEYRNKKHYNIVGHSLGGTVTQHVAQKRDLESIVRIHQKDATFRAYSFNSIGVDSKSEPVKHQNIITSVRVAGEILEQLQASVKRKQIGHIFRYGVLSDQSSKVSGIRLHMMKSVKKKICDCLADSRRMFEYGYR